MATRFNMVASFELQKMSSKVEFRSFGRPTTMFTALSEVRVTTSPAAG